MSKEKEYYRKGIDAARRIVDLMEGAEGDYADLENELQGPEYGPLVEKLSDGGEILRSLDEFGRPEVKREVYRFRRQVARRSLARRIAGISTAAAAVAALLAGGWYFMRPDGNADNVAVEKVADDVKLTLPDGSQVVLDKTTANSRVAEHGNVTLSMEDGVLVSENHSSPAQAPDRAGTSTIEVPRGSLFSLILADGTKVWINADSKLRFPIEFMPRERKVWLEGEAYFEVAHDAGRPFIVETNDQTLRVLGTKFNIYAYPDERSVFTSLVEGSVSVRANGGGGEVVLNPGQQARLSADTDVYTVADVDVAGISSWRERMFIFNENTLEFVFSKLSRWYDFEYVFEDPKTATTVMMGNIPVDNDFAAVIAMINDAKVANIELNGNLVTIKSK